MTILHFKPQEFFDYLEQHNCHKYSDKHVDKDLIEYERNDILVYIQLRSSYYPEYVCKICEAFNIHASPDFEKVRDQLLQ